MRYTTKDGISKTVDLPKALANGITLQVANSTAEIINLKIIANSVFFESNKDKSFFIVAQNKQCRTLRCQAKFE